jgi:hypothetical protein
VADVTTRDRENSPYRQRDGLRAALLELAAAVVPDGEAVVAFDAGPAMVGALNDGSGGAVTSRLRVEVGIPAPAPADPATRLATARRHLSRSGWSVVRSGATGGATELVAVRDGAVLTVTGHPGERRLVLLGETPPAHTSPH